MVTMTELLGNTREYVVPPFQRGYSWGEDEWVELWEDIEQMADTHYMGYIVLQKSDQQEKRDDNVQHIIIDGQQRIATLSVFALAVISLLDDPAKVGALFQFSGASKDTMTDENQHRREQLAQFLKWNDPVKPLESRIRLTLGGESDAFYRNHILRLRRPASMHRVSRSDRRLWDALEFFQKKIRGRFNGDPNGEDLARLLSKKVAKGLMFTEMHVPSEDAAYAIFETLNARGAMLSSPDLLKNFLFATVEKESGKDGLRKLGSQWGKMLDALGRQDLTPFLRHLWHSLGYEPVGKKRLFKAIREGIKGASAALAFMDVLEDSSGVYADMLTPSSNSWPDKEQLRMLQSLKIYGVSSHYPLALAAFRKWGSGAIELTKILRQCSVLSFRRTVIGNQVAKELEQTYAKAAGQINRGVGVSDIRRVLKDVDVTDEFFVNAFAEYNAESRKKRAVHILLEIERQMGGARHDPASSGITIEHILPQEPDKGWNAFDSDIDRFIWRLGNLTLLSATDNRQCNNSSFAKKRDIYRRSEFKITQQLADFDEWTPGNLDARQRQLADYAKEIWRLE